jgi:hypothetical protein
MRKTLSPASKNKPAPTFQAPHVLKIANAPDGQPATHTFQNNLLSRILTGNTSFFPLMRQQGLNTLPDIFGLSSPLNRK